MSKGHWLNLAEYIFIASSVGGIVATSITKEVLFSVSPLTLALFLNVINRQRQINQFPKLPQSLEQSIKKQQESLAELLQFNATNNQRIEGVETALNNFEPVIKEQQESVAELLQFKVANNQRIEGVETVLNQLKQLEASMKEQQEFKDRTIERIEELDRLNNKFNQFEQIIKEQKESLEELSKIMPSIIQRLYELEKSNNNLNSSKEEIKTLQNKLEELLNFINRINQEIDELKTSVNNYSASEQVFKNIQNYLETFSQRISVLESSVNNYSVSEETLKKIQNTLGEFLKFTETFNQRLADLETSKNNFNFWKNKTKELEESLKSIFDFPCSLESDYSKLTMLLASQQWQEADQETANKMLEIMDRQKKEDLNHKNIKNFPLEQLKIIDQLWIHFSNGKFGFSVQQNIWIKLGDKIGDKDDDIYKAWAKKVGWRANGSWKKYDELDFTINAPNGHLPAVTLSWSSWGSAWCKNETIELFSRLNYNSSTYEPQTRKDPLQSDLEELFENLQIRFKKPS